MKPGPDRSYPAGMEVSFERTGERRYATVITLPGQPPRRTDPAPGFHEHIPHDLVHHLPIGGALRFTWPDTSATVTS